MKGMNIKKKKKAQINKHCHKKGMSFLLYCKAAYLASSWSALGSKQSHEIDRSIIDTALHDHIGE